MNFYFKNKYVSYVLFGVVALLICNAVFQTLRSRDTRDKEFAAEMSSLHADVESAISDAQEFREKSNSVFESIDEDFIVLVKIADSYYDLSQKTQLSSEDKNMLAFYYDYITEYGLDLSGKIDDKTLAFQGSHDELDELMAARVKSLYVQAAKEALPGAIEQKQKLEEALAEAEKALSQAQD